MTFLPIVARELRVASRRRWTYWGRFGAALLAVIAFGVVLLAEGSPNPNDIGSDLFATLAVLVFFSVAIVGTQLTCDCLSAERREGTLGLLFLTDLRGYDVVFGKLAATSLHAAYSIMAVLPVLAIPLLLGGVTHGEIWRVALVSANLLFFFLSVGMFSSSVCREDHRGLALSIFLSLAVLLAAPLLASWWELKHPGVQLPDWCSGIPSPAFGCGTAFEANYGTEGAAAFWCNALATQIYSWIFLLLACWIVPRSWQETAAGPKRGKWRDLWRAFSHGSAAARAVARLKLLEINPFLWRAGRPRVKYFAPWAFLVIAAAGWFVCGKLMDNRYLFDEPTDLLCAGAVHFVLKVWVASEACCCFAEDRRSGALELLLTTPLGAAQIVRGQRHALWRQFAAPVAAVLFADLLFLYKALGHETDHDNREAFIFCYLNMGAFLVGDMDAISWLSMRLGLSGRKPVRIIMLSFWWAVLLPALASLGICLGLIMLEVRIMPRHFQPSSSYPRDFALSWAITSLAADLIIIAAGKSKILDRFREGFLERAAALGPPRLPPEFP